MTARSSSSISRAVHNGASYPAWSPDSQRLAFLSDHEDAGVYELYVHHVRGEHAGELWKINGPLAIDRDVTSFRWSPTGSSIAYRALEDDDWDLYIADVGGDAPTPAVRVNGGIAPVEEDEELWERTGYRFAPDGQSIFFIAPQSSPWVGRELFWVDLRGGSPAAPVRIRPPEAPWNVERAGWSPDGRWILYSSNATLFLVEMIPTPSPAIQISGTEFPGGAWANTFPEWSPDSTQIAYQADSPDPGDAYHLFVVDVTDESPSPPRQINGPLLPGESLPDNGIGRRSFAWSADGDLLAYVSREQGLVALRFVDTSAPLPWQATVASQPSARDVTPYQLRFAPADRRLVYRAEETPGVWELFVVDLGSGGPHEPTRVNAPLTLAGSVEIELVSRPVHAWDPTGAFIAYRADQAVNERFELWVVDASLPGFSSPVNGPLVPAGDVHGFAWAPTAGPP
jgi:Tol biopolymer transport system component